VDLRELGGDRLAQRQDAGDVGVLADALAESDACAAALM
jgi:hypothetical protein